MGRGRFDLVAASASVLALAPLVAYLAIMREQGDEPLALVVTALGVGAAAAAYGAVRPAPFRRVVLGTAGFMLLGLGFLAILSIGLPILAAGGLCLVTAGRDRDPRSEDPGQAAGAQTV